MSNPSIVRTQNKRNIIVPRTTEETHIYPSIVATQPPMTTELSLEEHIKVCEKAGPRALTLNLLCSLTETYKAYSHELPRLVILENASKALMDTTVEEISNALDDWVTTRKKLFLKCGKRRKLVRPVRQQKMLG